MRPFIFLSLISLLAQPAIALEHYRYECIKDSVVKNIAVEYGSKSKAVPCKVIHSKPDDKVTLWHADTQAGYCEAKAKDFADNQILKGWQCRKLSGKL